MQTSTNRRCAGPALEPPLLRNLPLHYFDSQKDGELQGSQVANIVKARGNLRTVTAALPMPQGALLSVAVRGSSCVDVEIDPQIFILRFGIGGRYRYESRGQPPGHGRDTVLWPGTRFCTFGENESSLLLALHRRAIERALGCSRTAGAGIHTLPQHSGSALRQNAMASARSLEQLPDSLHQLFLRNFQNAAACALASLLREIQPDLRVPDPMIGRRKMSDLRDWATLDRDDPLTVGDLAARCGLGLRALQKNFLRHFDATPGEFLRGLRLDKARQLILGGTFTVTHAALEAGFVHLGHFSVHYGKRFGELPHETLRRRLPAARAQD